jgi:hypothetical protein
VPIATRATTPYASKLAAEPLPRYFPPLLSLAKAHRVSDFGYTGFVRMTERCQPNAIKATFRTGSNGSVQRYLYHPMEAG